MKTLISSLFALLFVVCTFNVQDVLAQSQTQIFQNLVQEISAEDFQYAGMQFSNTTIRKDHNQQHPYTYTAHDQSTIYLRNNVLTAKLQQIAFSDRNHFQGKKDKSTMKIYVSGGRVRVQMTSITWGGSYKLDNVRIEKNRFGYFITAHKEIGSRITKYTIAIHSAYQLH